jgi:hypothetical protein
MGEAYAAVADEATAVYWNPAALAVMRGKSAVLMRATGEASSALNHGAYAQSVGRKWGAGLAVTYQTVGTLTQRDDLGVETGHYTPSDAAAALALARRSGPFSAGAAVKYVRSKIVDDASAAAADIGFLWRSPPQGRFRLAFTASNLGGKIKYEDTAEALPAVYRVGTAWKTPRLILSADAVAPAGEDAWFAAGVEIPVVRAAPYALALRAGYRTRSTGEPGSLSGASFGLGVGVGSLGIDYAFLPMGSAGDSHRLSLTFRFLPVSREMQAAPARSGGRTASPGSVPSSQPRRRGPGPR